MEIDRKPMPAVTWITVVINNDVAPGTPICSVNDRA